MSGLRETNETTMIAAHKAGMEYYHRNKPHNVTDDDLRSLARTCGWHGDDEDSWVAGFRGAHRRDSIKAISGMQSTGVDDETNI